MKEAVLKIGAKFESNTYYKADKEKYDFHVSDATRTTNPEHFSHTTSGGGYMDLGFYLDGLENTVLDFCGATLVFHGRIQPFMISNCKNVAIKNVKIDYDRPFYTQATVLSCTEDTMRLSFDDGFTCRTDPEHRGLVAVSNTWEYRMNRNDCLLWLYDMKDRESHSIILSLFGDEIYPKENPPMPISQILVDEDDEAVIFHGKFPADWVGREDHKLVITHEPRDKSCVHITGGEDITVDHVQVIHGAAMGLTGMHTKNIKMNHFDFIGNYNGNDRIVTNNADGIHLFNCYGRIDITNCTMEGLLDDVFNIHGNFIAVSEVLEDGVWCSPKAFGLSSALKLFMPGDRIAVYKGRTRELKAEFTVVAEEADTVRGGRILRFEEKELLDTIACDDIIENLSANPDVLIENCTFKRFRGTSRLQTGGKCIVRGCTFENKDIALIVTGDTEYWFESGPVKDLTIENCHFAFANFGYRIGNSTQVQYTEKAPFYHSGITIKNCFFDGPYVCSFDHVDDITVMGNKSSADEMLVHFDACGKLNLDGVKEV